MENPMENPNLLENRDPNVIVWVTQEPPQEPRRYWNNSRKASLCRGLYRGFTVLSFGCLGATFLSAYKAAEVAATALAFSFIVSLCLSIVTYLFYAYFKDSDAQSNNINNLSNASTRQESFVEI